MGLISPIKSPLKRDIVIAGIRTQAMSSWIDDATLQLAPRCYRFKMPRFEEQNVDIYIFKSLYSLQSFKLKLLDGHSCSEVSIPDEKARAARTIFLSQSRTIFECFGGLRRNRNSNF